MNEEKLKKMQAQVRIGGKGTPRRKKKIVHATSAADDKKLQGALKKLALNSIPGIEEVNMMKDDATVVHFNNPKVKASLSSNIFAITGQAETKYLTELLPSILAQLGTEGLCQLKQFASSVAANTPVDGNAAEHEDDVPQLVENFEDACKEEITAPE